MDTYSFTMEDENRNIDISFCRGYLNIKGLSNEDLVTEFERTREVVTKTYNLEKNLEMTLETHKNCVKEAKLQKELLNCKLDREIVTTRFHKLQEEYVKRIRKGRIIYKRS